MKEEAEEAVPGVRLFFVRLLVIRATALRIT